MTISIVFFDFHALRSMIHTHVSRGFETVYEINVREYTVTLGAAVGYNSS